MGVTNYAASGQYEKICSALVSSSDNVPTNLAAKNGITQTGIDKANRDLTRVR